MLDSRESSAEPRTSDTDSVLGKRTAGRKTKKFKVKISAYAAPWVEEDPWHPEQVIRKHADGSITLTVSAAHDMEVIPRILSLGTEAELLSPAASRNAMSQTIRTLHSKYR